ncbi:hypothetical protein HYH03_013106 [Edaphochlamys debaryana]|uniref:Uncharacterized protein n=1 Tax=Edaphochlamys debaryana TaxID=47281 RepID=A0A835XRR8_9CHLO|nr:hypothetical protein HYH03_013106 [Edaphochlamys debaryana]|eukprot:KAG2488422.1 hypothetical protein HYH03_013106 [Edaphochlamys debaryana]
MGCNLPGYVDALTPAYTCDEVNSVTYTIPLDMTTIPLQIHDGQITGNLQSCSGNGLGANQCCGGLRKRSHGRLQHHPQYRLHPRLPASATFRAQPASPAQPPASTSA